MGMGTMDKVCRATGDPAQGLKINPRCRWIDTGIDVAAGQTLRFDVEGWWVDFFIPTDPDGFDFNPAGAFGKRRCPGFPWLSLVGALDQSLPEAFLIGDGASSKTFVRAGRLFVFANDNDGHFARANNWGDVTLKIT